MLSAFEVPGEEGDRFIAGWEKTRDYLASQPDYAGTALHQAVTPGADLRFINIGRWQIAEDFRAATQSPGFKEWAVGLAGYHPYPGLYAWCAHSQRPPAAAA